MLNILFRFCINIQKCKSVSELKFIYSRIPLFLFTFSYQHTLWYIYIWVKFIKVDIFPKYCHFFATLTAVYRPLLHYFILFNCFFWPITCAAVEKTKLLTSQLRLGTWKVPLNMDDFEVFSHLFPFCISSYKPEFDSKPSEIFIF